MKTILILIVVVSQLLTGCATIKYENESTYKACEDGKYRVSKNNEGEPSCIEKRFICPKEYNLVIKSDGTYNCELNAGIAITNTIGLLAMVAWLF